MTKNILNIGIPSKGRLRKDVLNIFKKNKLNLISERGERDLLGSIKQYRNIKFANLSNIFRNRNETDLHHRVVCRSVHVEICQAIFYMTKLA